MIARPGDVVLTAAREQDLEELQPTGGETGQRARQICSGERWDELTDAVVARTTDPWTAADEMLAAVDA